MSRKRGKQRKAPVEAVPEDILAEGSGPVRRIEQDAIATVDDVVTTEDIATTEDVVTADDVVATPGAVGARSDPEPEEPPEPAEARPKRAGRSRKSRRSGRDSTPGAGDTDGDAPRRAEGADASEASGSEIDAAAPAGDAAGEVPPPQDAAGDGSDHPDAASGHLAAEDVEGDTGGAGPDRIADLAAADDAGDASSDGEAAGEELRASAAEGAEPGADGELGDAAGDSAGAGDEDDDDAAGVFPTSAATMDAVQLKHLVEALIFAADRPLTVQRLRQLTRVGDVRRLEQALSEIDEDYRERGLVLQQVSGGYQFRTRTQFSPWVQQLIAGRPVRLSRAQLETLAIIAYRQPITRPEIDDIRGVDSSATLKLLIDRALIRILGKREEVGRPMLYGTTKEFLDFFSLGDLRELPTLREYSELTAESRKVMSDRLGIAVDGSDGPDGGGEDPEGGSSNGHGSNGHGSNGHGGHGGYGGGGDDGGAGGPSGLGGGGLSDDGPPASAAARGDDAGVTAAENDADASGLAEDGGAEAAAGASRLPEEAAAVSAAEDDAGGSGLAEDAVAASAAEDAAGGGGFEDIAAEDAAAATSDPVDHGELADGSGEDDAPGCAPPDEVSEALSAFWAASDAVDRSSAEALGDSEGDAPADTWFDPAIGNSLDDLVDAGDPDEPGDASRPNTGPRAAE